MEAMRATWTDARLDDLNERVARVGEDVRDLRIETREAFAEVRAEIADLKRILIQLGGGLIGTLLVCMSGLIATQI
jgi:hypothetical protein